METMEKQEKDAEWMQKIHCDLLNGSSFDVIPGENLSCVKTIFLQYFPESVADELAGKFYQRRIDLKFRIILVNCLIDGNILTTAVVRVLEHGKAVFYDSACRRYTEWEDYLSSNVLPKCQMIFPKNGSYKKKNERVLLDKRDSPSKSTLRQVDDVLIVGAEMVSLASLFLPMFSFAKPYATHIRVASGISNGYRVGHHSYKLYDRYVHDQSISFNDKGAAHHWFHIGNGFLSFAFTFMQTEFGKTIEISSENDIMNAVSLIKFLMVQESPEKLNVVRGHILSHYLLQFSDTAAEWLPEVCKLFSDHPEFLSNVFICLRQYLNPKNDKVFRKLFYVNVGQLKKVAQDVKTESTIPKIVNNNMYDVPHMDLKSMDGIMKMVSLMKNGQLKEVAQDIKTESTISQIVNNKMYDDLHMFGNTVDDIMKEVNLWKNGEISDKQLKFRVTEICHGGKKYETGAEMCDFYQVDSVDKIEVNGRRIFCNIGNKQSELKDLIENSRSRYPQLLLYAVEYASKQGNPLDWNEFKPNFIKRINEEALSELQVNGKGNGINWIYALNKKEVNFSLQCTENTIDLVSPKNRTRCSVDVQDLLLLSKRLLGSFEFDLSVAKDLLEWVIVLSKRKKNVIIVGPSIVIECPMRTTTYPLWIRSL